ncbi:MAG TPA: YggT family protein [Coriobacteriia bacterium]
MTGSLISALITVIGWYETLIFIYVILSWFRSSGGAVESIYRALGTVCEPFVGIFRRLIPMTGAGIDFSPMIAMIALIALQRLLAMLV